MTIAGELHRMRMRRIIKREIQHLRVDVQIADVRRDRAELERLLTLRVALGKELAGYQEWYGGGPR
jgi:hypothetical protein